MRDDERAREYCRKKNMMFLWNSAVTLGFISVMGFGFSIPLRKFVTGMTENSVIVITLYFFLFYCAYFLVTLGLKYYEGIVLERKFNGTDQNLPEWFTQVLKREGLTFLLLLPVIQTVYFFVETSPKWWWLTLTMLSAAGVIFFTEIFPHYCLPLIYRYRPLTDPGLKKQLLDLGTKARFRFDNVYVMQQHGHSATAVIFGLGPIYQLMISDTLLDYAGEEAAVVVAREMAYHYFRQGWKQAAVQAGSLAVIFLTVSLIFEPVTGYLGFILPFDIATLPVFLGLFLIVFTGFSFVWANLRQRFEREADLFALQITQAPEAFISLLISRDQENLRNPSPRYFFEAMLARQSPAALRMVIAQDYAQSLRSEKHYKKQPGLR